MAITIKTKRGLEARWILKNPILAAAERGLVTDLKCEVIGDGVTPYLGLTKYYLMESPGGDNAGTGTGLTPAQAAEIALNTAKRSYPSEDQSKLSGIAVGATVGATVSESQAIALNTAKVGITQSQSAAIVSNTTKVDNLISSSQSGATSAQINAIALNTAKVGITAGQANQIVLNAAKVTYPNIDAVKLAGIEPGATVGATPSQAAAIAVNSAKYGISIEQANAITANTIKRTYPSLDESKLASIESGATRDQTPTEIVDAVNSKLGGTGWQSISSGGSGTGATNTDQLPEGNYNKYYTDAKVIANSQVIANSAKVGITPDQADAIVVNTAKVGITQGNINSIAANTAKVGITPAQASAITANTAKRTYPSSDETKLTNIESGATVGATTPQIAAIAANTAKVGITALQASEIASNTAKVGITPAQASAITTNTAKVGITPAQASNITANNAKVGITPGQADAILANAAKVGITTAQASDIAANKLKVGITLAQSNAITQNTAKVGITPSQASAITANTAKVGITTSQSDAIIVNSSKRSFPTSFENKLNSIEEMANRYEHPITHPASIIVQDPQNRFVTDAMINTWNENTSGGSINTLTENAVLLKSLSETFAELQLRIDALPKYLGGYSVIIQSEDGEAILDSNLVFTGFFGGRIIIEGESGSYVPGVDQLSTWVFDNNNRISFLNCYVNIEINWLHIKAMPNSQAVLFNIDGNSVVTSKYNYFNLSGANQESFVFFLAGCRLASDGDTVSGSTLATTNLVDLARGSNEGRGGELVAHNTNMYIRSLNYAAIGRGTAAFNNVGSAFLNKVGMGAIDISQQGGGSSVGVNTPVVSSGEVIDITNISATARFEFNRKGTILFGVYGAANLVPTKSALKIGTGSAHYGSINTEGMVMESAAITSLSGSTPYKVYYFGEDELNNESPLAMVPEFITNEPIVIPDVTTGVATNVTSTSATLVGNLVSTNNGTISARGFVIGSNINPTLSNTVVSSGGLSIGAFTADITDLMPESIIHYRAYATNEAGTSYGADGTITMESSSEVFSLTTEQPSIVDDTTTLLGAKVSGLGDKVMSEYGFVYSLNTEPVITDAKNKIGTSITGDFIIGVSGLTPNTTYYLRSYIGTNEGTFYGNEVVITTLAANVVLGPEILGLPRTFLAWSKANGVTISDDMLTATYDGITNYGSLNAAYNRYTESILPSTMYRITFDVSNTTGIFMAIIMGTGNDVIGTTEFKNGSHSIDYMSPITVGASPALRFNTKTPKVAGSISNVSVKRILPLVNREMLPNNDNFSSGWNSRRNAGLFIVPPIVTWDSDTAPIGDALRVNSADMIKEIEYGKTYILEVTIQNASGPIPISMSANISSSISFFDYTYFTEGVSSKEFTVPSSGNLGGINIGFNNVSPNSCEITKISLKEKVD